MIYYSSKGEEIKLENIIGSGGEGKIYTLRDYAGVAAKIYNTSVGEEKSDKLSAMVRLNNPRLARISAWPIDTLHSEASGPVVGFTMEMLWGKSIHLLYSPKSRIAEFPGAGWDFLLLAAANLARAFAVMHDTGHVIGDVNHGNAYIQNDATVMLIDCDSFQINDSGRRYLCEVGVMTHQPPEFQRISTFKEVVREAKHDNFGLAVLIFQLLFMGRHPFSGRYLGEGEMPIERAIQEHRFAYGLSAKSRQMEEPPNSIPIDAVSREIFTLFERAFIQELRPKAREWVLALDRLRTRLKACSNPFHKYYEGLSSCPFCHVESKTGVVLFNNTGVISASQRIFNITGILKEINSLQGPGGLPSIPSIASVKLRPTKEYLLCRNKCRNRRILSAIIAATGAGGIFLTGIDSIGALLLIITATAASGFTALSAREESLRMLKEARAAFNAAGRQLDIYIKEWNSTASDRSFNDMRSELLKLAEEYEELTVKGQKMQRTAEENIRKYQLQKFLDSFRIYDAKIDKINHTRKATLQSYGVETAADIDPRYLALIPGITPKYANNLIEWRKKIEGRFVFNPDRGVDAFQLAEIHKNINEEKSKLENELSKGAMELKSITEETRVIRNELLQKLEWAQQEYAQAEANLIFCSRPGR